jgi:multicomponent Na+:H+ antiporter subunit E
MNRILRFIRALDFALFFVKEVLVANWRLFRDICGDTEKLSPGLVRMPLDLASDRQRWLLATCITMTPGTLSLGYDPATRELTIHALHADRPEELVASLKNTFERRIRDVCR